ncbi:MAG: hypothetical protein IJ151_02010 [Bacteroidales bacterium]|nr:hypothetical protein [Bacteroidales bacterium]
MKTNKLLTLTVFFAFAFISCTKEAVTYGLNTETNAGTDNKAKYFVASVESSPLTKTALYESKDGYDLKWSYKDRIKVYSGNAAVLFETESSYATSANFSPVDGAHLPAADKYIAFYPASLDKDNLTLPEKQTWTLDSVKGFPMYAESDTRNLSFHNLCGIIRFRIKVKTADTFNVSKITLSCENSGLSGAFRIVNDAAVVTSKNTAVTLECNSAVNLYTFTATDFFITVPAGNYYPLLVNIASSDGKEKNYVSDGSIPVKRSEITSINLTIDASSTTDGSLESIPVSDIDVNFSER